MSSANNQQALNAWFGRFRHFLDSSTPAVIGETANEYYRESFNTKSFAGVPWPKAKKPAKRGSLMVRSGALVNSIRVAVARPDRVRLSAGNSRVPYAKVHNEGEIINRAARTETFVRNRYKTGAKSKYFGGMGAFKRGTTLGQGMSFKAYSYRMPQRQFMGHSAALNKRIILRIRAAFNAR